MQRPYLGCPRSSQRRNKLRMKRKKKLAGRTKNLTLVFYFLVVVFFLVASSLGTRFISLLKASSFDGKHRFTMQISSQDKEAVRVLSFAPDTKTISIAVVEGLADQKSVGNFLGIPIEGRVVSKNSLKADTVSQDLRKMLFGYPTLETNLTLLDIFRLWLFSQSVMATKISERIVPSNLDQTAVDKISSNLFLDYSLNLEDVSIEIVNATNVFGLGNRLARVITNMGGNVVAVSTAKEMLEKSQAGYRGDKSYTLEKLQKILQFELVPLEGEGISDIVIKIGKDSIETEKF